MATADATAAGGYGHRSCQQEVALPSYAGDLSVVFDTKFHGFPTFLRF